MKTIKVVAAIIIHVKIKFLRHSVDMENLKTAGNFRAERSSQVRRHRKRWSVR